MYIGLLIICTLLALGQSEVNNSELKAAWNSFKTTFGKLYKIKVEEIRRLALFTKRFIDMVEHNKRKEKGLESWEMGINFFSDMTEEEISRYTLGRNISIKEIENNRNTSNARKFYTTRAAPNSIDWRTRGAVTSVKNQGLCGSCWSFSVTGAIESHAKIHKGRGPTPLSEQQLVDCDLKNGGCEGGWMTSAFDYIKYTGGLTTEYAYPYVARRQQCQFDHKKVVAKVSGKVDLPGNENALKEACGTQGPISVAVYASEKFAKYKSGIFEDDACTNALVNHAILVVGYGTENGRDYWLCKNSWSDTWGEKGYIKIARNRNNMCSISSIASYPIIQWAK